MINTDVCSDIWKDFTIAAINTISLGDAMNDETRYKPF